MSNDIEKLKNFVLNNYDLERLETILLNFNVFETLNIVKNEIRHSNVLAWLLNPYANHGIGTYFLDAILKRIIERCSNRDDLHLSIFDIELFKYTDVEIRREWNNIDLLIIINEPSHKLVICIENKIGSEEHSDQLTRYKNIVKNEFTSHQRLFILLTPYGITPTDEEWESFEYLEVVDQLDKLLTYRKSFLNENVLLFINNYNDILRRYLVGESELEKICKQIYNKHKDAIDIIFQYRPDTQLEISEYLQEKIKSNADLIIDTPGKSSIRFTSHLMDPKFKKISEGWSKSKRIILYEFSNYSDKLQLLLYIGPGPTDYRNNLLNMFKLDKKLFNRAEKRFGKKWHAVYQKIFLSNKDYEGVEIETLYEIIDEKWSKFIENDFPKIEKHIETHWEEER